VTYTEAFDEGYRFVLESVNESENESKKIGLWSKFKNMCKRFLDKVKILLSVKIPNFFRNLFNKHPEAKNMPEVQSINKKSNRVAKLAKTLAGLIGVSAAGYGIYTIHKTRKSNDSLIKQNSALKAETYR